MQFLISGYFKDDKTNFTDYLVNEYDDVPEGHNDDDYFFWTIRKRYNIGDVIGGDKLDDLSGGLVGNDKNKYMLVQQDLSIFPYTRQDLIDLDPEYADEEIWRLESMKDNFYKTPPIPQEGDGMHRIIAAKELGYKTILMWKQI